MGTFDTIGGTPRHDPSADHDPITPLQENVLRLLEAADIPTDVNDRIMELVAEGERRIAPPDHPEAGCFDPDPF